MLVTDGKIDLDSEALLIRLEMLLLMPMKEDLKTAADGACDNRKHADEGRFEDYCRWSL
jgi:hypothetical protein